MLLEVTTRKGDVMGIKRHIADDYPRRDTVSHIRHWEVSRDAMSTLCVAYGYPALREPTPPRNSVPPFKEAPWSGHGR
jgi:hypothetical protein